MYRIWYWAVIDRESDDRFVANVPDLGDVSAWGETEKDAMAHVADLAGNVVRSLVETGDAVPRARRSGELPSSTRPNEIGRAMIAEPDWPKLVQAGKLDQLKPFSPSLMADPLLAHIHE